MAHDGIVSGQTVNNREGDILGNLRGVVINHYGQSDRTEGIYSCSSESNEWCVSWNQLFSPNPHLLECQVVEDICRALIIYKDPVSVVVPK